jgi:inosine-uridine nucleoside N-ribohydrolase
MPLHDLLAFYVLMDPTLVETEACEIRVETKSSKAFGMSLCDRKSSRLTHRVAVSVDSRRVLEKFSRLVDDLSSSLSGPSGRAGDA